MKKRLERVQTILRLQSSLRDISQAKLAAIEVRKKQLAADQSEIVSLLDRDLMNSGLLLTVSTKRLRALELEIASAALEHAEESGRAFRQASRAKAAETAASKLLNQLDEQERRKDLLDLIDRYQSNDGSRFA
jgi:hypothetical protein